MDIEEYEDFFAWYKARKKDIADMEDYFNNSDDFKMDCSPIPLSKVGDKE